MVEPVWSARRSSRPSGGISERAVQHAPRTGDGRARSCGGRNGRLRPADPLSGIAVIAGATSSLAIVLTHDSSLQRSSRRMPLHGASKLLLLRQVLWRLLQQLFPPLRQQNPMPVHRGAVWVSLPSGHCSTLLLGIGGSRFPSLKLWECSSSWSFVLRGSAY